ncbi:diguanylate cyclase [Pseudomonas fontis]|uniref:diguanylate cyclase n=1 Tax=Pseudomonas fontis TaxID=2942633 RepID=A0ABT5P1J5_9PSED|nr:diguanylate cyclase [Pseudomonas fontis]MDD0977333.1 diguanylate cyclase [Pseudomonas fontis]MDD0994174.1 diguanylate cyclase [Pseudomonas fontis]
MTENLRGKGLSFVRRIYLPRIIGLGIGLFSVYAAITPLGLPQWVWGLLFFNGLAWPHLAYQLGLRSKVPYQTERRNLLIDSLMGGFWTATMQFNPLPSVTILSMMTMNNVAAGGQRLLLKGAIAQVAGMLLSVAIFGPGLQLVTTPSQVYACLPMLTLYPLALGWVCYRLAIKLSEHKRTLSALSRTDSLTGLLNHGSWKDLLQLKFHASQQQQCESVIAIIDIDHFKRINDTYGHVVGDCVLRQLSSELKRTLREDDLAGRYGGDEFCVILPNTSLEQAHGVMERLRQQVSDFRNEQLPQLRISLSIGLASCRRDFEDPVAWLNEADQALYAAKNSGRNKVNFADADGNSLRLAYPD